MLGGAAVGLLIGVAFSSCHLVKVPYCTTVNRSTAPSLTVPIVTMLYRCCCGCCCFVAVVSQFCRERAEQANEDCVKIQYNSQSEETATMFLNK